MHPLILPASDHVENLAIHPLFHEHVSERLHQRTNPILGPIGEMVAQHQPLPKQRMRPPLHRPNQLPVPAAADSASPAASSAAVTPALTIRTHSVGRPTPTAQRLVEASVSPNTRRAYAGALRRLDAWLDGRELHDVTLAAYLAELHDAGRAASSASMAACFRAKLAGQPAPAGERTARVLAGYRRTAGDPGRGQARPFGVSDLVAVLATCDRPRRRGRGVRVGPGRPRARTGRCGDRGTAVHGGDCGAAR